MKAVVASEAINGFVRHLRLNGFQLGGADSAAALRAHDLLGAVITTDAAKSMLRTVLASERGEWERFGELFDAYWFGKGLRVAQPMEYAPAARKLWSRNLPQLESGGNSPPVAAGDEQDGGMAAEENASPAVAAHYGARHGTQQRLENNAVLLPEKEQIIDCGVRLAALLRRRPGRRRQPAQRGRGVNMRRTIRRSLSAGGDPLQLARYVRKARKTRFSVLLDVSGSMRAHYGLFLLFVKGMLAGGGQTEAFIFHTRLVRVTTALAERSTAKALEKFALQTQGVGGGTRIADCLDDFLRLYGNRNLGGRCAVIISDGYETGAPEKLCGALSRLRRRIPRLFWLTPAPAGAHGAAPQALAGALPQLTALAAARSLADLRALEKTWDGL